METVRQAVMRAAASPFPVLIEGESGSGKELVARAVHAASIRRGAAVLRAQLRGDRRRPGRGRAVRSHARRIHRRGRRAARPVRRGAGRHAVPRRGRRAERARAGQAAAHAAGRRGPAASANRGTRKVDARIVAATNRPLGDGGGSRTLPHRSALPPRRPAHHAFRRCANGSRTSRRWCATSGRCSPTRTGSRAVLSPSALSLLGSYDWPGNVRELQNVLASVMVAGPQRGVIGAAGPAGSHHAHDAR